MKLKALDLFAVFPLLVSFSSFAGGPCEGDTALVLQGFREADKVILVSSMVSVDGVEIEASIIAFSLDKGIRSVLWSPPQDIDGRALRQAFVNALSKETQKGFQPLGQPLVTASERLRKPKGLIIHEKSFEDPRGFGAFIVRRILSGKRVAFELAHRSKETNTETVLNKNLFLNFREGNAAGIQVSEGLFFVDRYVGGITHLCGTPFAWRHQLEHPPEQH